MDTSKELCDYPTHPSQAHTTKNPWQGRFLQSQPLILLGSAWGQRVTPSNLQSQSMYFLLEAP